ncbi:PAS domain-containing protein [Chloroflexota bacterium]
MLEKIPTAQLENILDHLPVEMSFINADDEVAYFSKGDKRILKRTPAVIGMKVQKCHPAQSVDKVQQILDDFKAKKRDSAEFWINLHGRLVYIRYFAVRDKENAYQGTLEVSQDITGIRAIEGEKRLL